MPKFAFCYHNEMKMRTFTLLYAKCVRFYKKTLWEDTPVVHRHPLRRFLRGTARRIVLTVRAFFRERMQYRASALTYITLLSTVPLLSVVVAIAKGFGLGTLIEQEIKGAFASQTEVVETLIGFVNSYLSHTQSGVFLGFGLLLLLWTLISLTGSIETTFNQIWQVKRERSTFRKITDYAAVFFLLPVLLVVTSGLSIFVTSFIEDLPDVLLLRPTLLTALKLAPYFFMCLLFTAIYAFMPNTKVRLKSAFVAAVPSGIAFQALQFFYIHSQMWLSSYNAIYGSFAALPLFMLWCQISWYICLFGATLSYVDQNIGNFYYGQNYTRISRRFHDFLCLSLAASICRRFSEGRQAAYTAEDLAKEKRMPIRLVTDLLYELCRAGVLMEVANDEKGDQPVFVPARDPKLITVESLLGLLDSTGNELARKDIKNFSGKWKWFEASCRKMLAAEFSATPLYKFADEAAIQKPNK